MLEAFLKSGVPVFDDEPDPNRPRAMQDCEFREQELEAWQRLLASNPLECDVHEFLERHSNLIPCRDTPSGMTGSKGALWSAVFSKPPLQGNVTRQPDFMWLAHNSVCIMPVCIEIERPGKQWFNLDGTPTAQLTQAIDQLCEWRTWFQVPENMQWFRSAYRLDSRLTRSHLVKPAFVLVYGRRTEFEVTSRHGGKAEHLARKRSAMESPDVTLMTFDRLYPNLNAIESVCVKRQGEDFRVVAISPTFKTGPHLISMQAHRFIGWHDAVTQNTYLDQSRKDYLIERLNHWTSISREIDETRGYRTRPSLTE